MRSNIAYDTATSYIDSEANDDLQSIVSSSSSSSSNAVDEFTKLKTERKKERRSRRLARSISGIAGNQSGSPLDVETLLLTELAEASHQAMMRGNNDNNPM